MTWPSRHAARPWIYGHRGVRGKSIAENTLAAFQRALAEGADGIEFDVRLNHEGAVLVFHDDSLERMTGGADVRPLFEISQAELGSVRLLNNGAIPTLEDVLTWAIDKDLFVNIELKPDEGNAERLAEAVLNQVQAFVRRSARCRVLLSSFSLRVHTWVQEHNVELPYGILIEVEQRQLPVVPPMQHFGLHPNARSPLLHQLREAWAFTNVWTVNDPQLARDLDSAGIDGIITDCPGVIRSLFG